MRRHALGWTTACVAGWLAALACSKDDKPAPPSRIGDGSGGASFDAGADREAAGSGGSGEAGGTGGDATSADAGGGALGSWDGSTTASGDASPDAPAEAAVCGDGVVAGTEACDGQSFLALGCADLGFDQGSLACRSDCSVDTRGCSGTETCADGRDNDGDGNADCLDADCRASCADACLSPTPLPPGVTVQSTTAGHADTLGASCSEVKTGPDLAYVFTPTLSGELTVEVSSQLPLTVSVRGTCGAQQGETGCASSWLAVPTTANVPVYVIVDGASTADVGQFSLIASERQIVCGDKVRALSEECDDGNLVAGDGCGPTCLLEPSEAEPNKTPSTASAFASPFFGSISPGGDLDWFVVDVAQDNTTLTLTTRDFGDGACSLNLLDNVLTLFAPDGTTVLATDDDSGPGFCASLGVTGLVAGTYYARVEASPLAALPTFPYIIDTTSTP